MALIKCPECGKEFSDRAESCPNCGCPTETIVQDFSSTEHEEISETGFHITKKINCLEIDEASRKFRVPLNSKLNKKNSKMKGLLKGTLAVYTMGMSVVAEKAINATKPSGSEIYNFSDLISYELLEDDSQLVSGGVGQALVAGAVFGGAGAIAGGITGKRKTKKVVESLIVKMTLNDFNNSCLLIPLITKPTKTSSGDYKNAFNEAHQIISALDVITHNK